MGDLYYRANSATGQILQAAAKIGTCDNFENNTGFYRAIRKGCGKVLSPKGTPAPQGFVRILVAGLLLYFTPEMRHRYDLSGVPS